tara:strand:+ start:7255 stop:7836 length:582 start_codon:yes stop_codon:yes gene_type:complete
MNLIRENCIENLKDSQIQDHFGIKFQEVSFINKINLRIDPNNNLHTSTCEKILGAILPTKPNTFTENEKVKIIWLSPDEWIIVNKKEKNLLQDLENELGNKDASVTDISENKTIIKISGNKIYKLLSKFLVLDLEKNLSNESACAQTLFVKVPILLVRNNNEKEIPELDIFVNRSQSNYVYNLIVDGTQNLDF